MILSIWNCTNPCFHCLRFCEQSKHSKRYHSNKKDTWREQATGKKCMCSNKGSFLGDYSHFSKTGLWRIPVRISQTPPDISAVSAPAWFCSPCARSDSPGRCSAIPLHSWLLSQSPSRDPRRPPRPACCQGAATEGRRGLRHELNEYSILLKQTPAHCTITRGGSNNSNH